MKIHADVINALKNLDLLKEERVTSLPIIQQKTVKIAERSINSLKWENFVLEKDGDFSVYLFKNHSDIHKHWNSLAIVQKRKSFLKLKND